MIFSLCPQNGFSHTHTSDSLPTLRGQLQGAYFSPTETDIRTFKSRVSNPTA